MFALLFSFSAAAQTPKSVSEDASTRDQKEESIPRPPSDEQMAKILKHLAWLRDKKNGQHADFPEEDLIRVNLSGKDLDQFTLIHGKN